MSADREHVIAPAWDAWRWMGNGQPAKAHAAAALAAREEWEQLYAGALVRSDRLVPPDLAPRCRLLLQTAREEGLALWVHCCAGSEPAVRCPADLRAWSDLLYTAMRTEEDLGAGWVCQEEGGGPAWGAYAMALPLFSPLRPLGPGDGLDGWVRRLCLATIRKCPSRDFGLPECHHPLVRRLWDHMRRLGSGWPAEPRSLYSASCCRDALGEVIAWCDAQRDWRPPPGATDLEAPPPPDEPRQAVEWTPPNGPLEWARVFGVSYKTMKEWLDTQKIRNEQLSPRRYRIAAHELPLQDGGD